MDNCKNTVDLKQSGSDKICGIWYDLLSVAFHAFRVNENCRLKKHRNPRAKNGLI